MNLIGEKVTHMSPNGQLGKYGDGIIVNTRGMNVPDYIHVKFDHEENEKVFPFPECFDRYLLMNDSDLADQIRKMQKELLSSKKEKPQQKKEAAPILKASINDVLCELDDLVGLNEVKHNVHMLTSFLQINNLRKEHGLKAPVISKHLVFTGNPGTGKTTVARMIARIYYAIGAIKTSRFVETSRADLVAGYIGQTAIKTQEVIEKALGGVLFIDEAYALLSPSENDFGIEAINTLLNAMENYRDNLVVIVAGYKDRMDQFINANPGLASRFNHYFHFSDYDQKELMSIFTLLCQENEYELQKEARKRICTYLNEVCKKQIKDFGNGRFVRNLFEKIITCQAERVIALKDIDETALIQISLSDVENAINVAA